jgi:hypothetical protein
MNTTVNQSAKAQENENAPAPEIRVATADQSWLEKMGPGIVTGDFWFATITQLIATTWLCIEFLVMMARMIAFPLPRVDVIDIRGAFRTLWRASFWPQYLLRK